MMPTEANHGSAVNEYFALPEKMSLSELSEFGIAATDEQAKLVVAGIARFGHTASNMLCFCDREPSADYGNIEPGSIVLTTPELAGPLSQRFAGSFFISLPDPRAAFIDLGMQLLERSAISVSSTIDRPFGVHPSAKIGHQTVIHPETRIDENVVIGAQCVIHRGTWIKQGSIVRDNTVIGVEGINAYRGLDGRQRNFPHLAGVIVGENSEIGANTVIVRGILNSTEIGSDCVIGNLCNIGHVVSISDKVWMSVGCLIGGHTTIGYGATLGMGVAVRDNVEIGEKAQIGMASVITKSVKPNTSMFGNPARPIAPIKAGPDR